MTMRKFRSLLFREFRLSRKSLILQLVLLLLMIGMTWGVMFSIGDDSPEDRELTTNGIVISVAMIANMSLLLDEVFRSDINSKWLIYSFALPITPMQRTAVWCVRKYSVCAVSVILSICNAELISVFGGNGFSVNYIVWNIAVMAAALIFSLPNDIILLRARTSEEFKKGQTKAGLLNVIILAVFVVAIWIASGITLEQMSEGEGAISLPKFSAASLGWAVPLLIAIMAADFFAVYGSFKSAYSNTGSSSGKDSADSGYESISSAKKSDFSGLLYKELKQNRLMLILAAAAPFLLTMFPIFFVLFGVLSGNNELGEVYATLTNEFIRVMMWFIGIFVVSGLMSEVFRGDDRKAWAYFVMSTPGGVREFIYRKYVISLLVNIVYMAAGFFAESLLAAAYYKGTGLELTFSVSPLYITGVYLLMFIGAFDIPFTVRFGDKKGSLIKMISLLAISGALIGIFVTLPESFREMIVKALSKIMDGSSGVIPLKIFFGLFPFIAVLFYVISYKISCKLFVKGVRGYDK